jgi:predicted Zn-dependent protease
MKSDVQDPDQRAFHEAQDSFGKEVIVTHSLTIESWKHTAAPGLAQAGRRIADGRDVAMQTGMYQRWFTALAVCAVVLMSTRGSPQAAKDEPMDDEQQIGQEVFNELKAKGEIIESSPLYDLLAPIAAVTRTAQPRYNHPFKFYLVHEPQPNAFATPGGNIYVTDSLLYFVKNTEQLAGTLCHEVAHTIHHDTMTLIGKEQRIHRRELEAAVLLGPTRAHVLAIALIGKLRSLGYSREVESAADLTGADICAASSYNPWGLVWLFQDFAAADTAQVPQLLSDHPDNPHRVQALKRHFRETPAVFGSFSADPTSAKPFVAPKNAPVVFLR